MRGFVDIRPDERRATALACACLFGITAGHTLLETARDALFLAKLPPERLPFMYLAIAGVGLLLARLNKRRTPRARSRYALTMSLLVAGGVNAAFFVASSWKGVWLFYSLYVWTGIFASWVIVQFWLLLGNLFTVGQAKRLFGLIGAGSVLGAVVGAAFARALASTLASEHLLLGSAAMLGVTALGPALALRTPTTGDPPRGHHGAPPKNSFGDDFSLATRDPYVGRILGLVLLSTVALTTVDYLFKMEVAAKVPKEELGTFFANTYVAFNAAALVVQIGFVGWMLRTFGVHRALWVLPILVGGGAGFVLAGGGLLAALLLKGPDGALRHSLHRTSTELLYLPMPDATRSRAKPFIDLVGQRGGQAVASVAILALVAVGGGERALAITVMLLAGAWVLVAAGMRKPYLDVFRATLQRGRVDIGAGALPELDLGVLETLFGALNSARDAEVLGALELLAAQGRERIIPALILYHPSPAIVLKALDIFSHADRRDFLPIADRLVEHATPEVRAAALRARTRVELSPTLLESKLKDDCLSLGATAQVALIARGLSEGDEAQRALAEIVSDPSPAVRVALAQAIAEEPNPVFDATLRALAEAAEPEVRTEAAEAMGRSGRRDFIEPLFALLPSREPGAAARDALVAIGGPALAELDRSLGDLDRPRDLRWSIPRAIASFDPERAAPILVRHLTKARDGVIRFRIMQGLAKLRSIDPDIEIDRAVLEEATRGTIQAAFRLLDWRMTLERGTEDDGARATPAHDLLVTMLRDKEAHASERLFRLLGLSYPGENMNRIYKGLLKNDPKMRASARELCENLVKPPLREAILTLIDDLPDRDKLERAPSFYQRQQGSYDDALKAAFEGGGGLSAIVAYHAEEIGLDLGEESFDVAPIVSSVLAQALASQRREREGERSRV